MLLFAWKYWQWVTLVQWIKIHNIYVTATWSSKEGKVEWGDDAWWSQWLFRCLETAVRGENVPCRNASFLTQHNARSFIKLGLLNRHKRSVQSMVSAVQLLISAICMLLLNSSYTVLHTGFKMHADTLISYGTSEFSFQRLIKVKC